MKRHLICMLSVGQALWFPLLEAIMAPQRKLKETADKKYLDRKETFLLLF